MGRLDTTIKSSPVTSTTGGRLQKKVQQPVESVSAPKYFYAKTDPKGGAIGYSQNEFDSSGKPYFAYRNPTDTGTTTDKTRVATTFDPRVATTTPSQSFYNTRESNLREKVSGRLGTKPSEQVDHRTSLALSGSNDISNLRNWDTNKNQANAPKVKELQTNVSTGRLPLLNAQVDEAKAKSSFFNKVPTPWVPEGQIPKKESLLNRGANVVYKAGDVAGKVLPGLRAGVDSIVNKDASIYKNWGKKYIKESGWGQNLLEVDSNGKLKKDSNGKYILDPEQSKKTIAFVGSFTGGDMKNKITNPIKKSEVESLMKETKKGLKFEVDDIAEKKLFSELDKNVMSNRYTNIEKPKTVDGEIMSSGRLNQKTNTAIPKANATITNTSSRIIDDSIAQKKGLLQRAKEAYKNSSLSSQKGSVGGRLEKRIVDKSTAQTELEITEDVIANHPAKNLIKYMNKKTGELPQVTGGAKGKFANSGDDIVTELGYGDTSKLMDSIDEYKTLQSKAKQLRQDVTNERIAIAEANRNARIASQPLKYSAEGRPLALNAREKAIVSASQKEIPQTAKLKESALPKSELLSQGQSVNNGKVPSLDSIVKSAPTSVKEKVNILDYIRTPDRVMEKIGLGNETKAIRKGYESYIKELPTNIDKITQWSKQVSPESNQRIFQFLDGQTIDLTPNEAKVAGEIKNWLSQWADRLNLPEDNRISNYITHIFDKELIAKEFDEDLAKIIAQKIPGEVYDPFLLKRYGVAGFKQDTWQALDAYVKRATRKVHMDPALEMIKSKSKDMELSQFNYVKRYVDNVNLRPSELDTSIDNGIKSIVGYKYGQRPLTSLTKSLRQLTYRGMLGLNPGSALRNLSQGVNTYATLGEKYTIIGYSKLFSKGSIQELKDVGVLADSFVQDRTLSAVKQGVQKMDKVLFALFDTAEKINRGSAYFGAKSKALSQGKTLEQAIEYGKEVVRKTQFSFGSIDTPVALQNDLVKTLLQFQTYNVKQIEFITEMVKDKNFLGLLRYVVGGLTFTYTIGKAFGMEPEQLLPQFRFDTPPSLKAPVEVGKAVLNTPDKYGQSRDLEEKVSDVGKSTVGLIPAGNQIKKSYEGYKAIQEGGSFDKAGKQQFKQDQSNAGRLQSLLFGKYASSNARDYFNKVPTEAQVRYQKIQDLISSGKKDEAQSIVNSFSEAEYEQYKKMKSSAKAKATLKGKADIMPKVLEVQRLIKEGKEVEARRIVDSLTEDEYRLYKLAKKKI